MVGAGAIGFGSSPWFTVLKTAVNMFDLFWPSGAQMVRLGPCVLQIPRRAAWILRGSLPEVEWLREDRRLLIHAALLVRRTLDVEKQWDTLLHSWSARGGGNRRI